MGRLILVEDCPQPIELEPDDHVVALTPQACYCLGRAGIPYRRVDELAPETELAALEDRYWEEQLAWLGLLDELLPKELPERRPGGLATTCGLRLKRPVDIVFIRGFELASLLETGPDRVLLWRRALPEPPLDHMLWLHGGPSVLSRLLPRFCAQAGVACE